MECSGDVDQARAALTDEQAELDEQLKPVVAKYVSDGWDASEAKTALVQHYISRRTGKAKQSSNAVAGPALPIHGPTKTYHLPGTCTHTCTLSHTHKMHTYIHSYIHTAEAPAGKAEEKEVERVAPEIAAAQTAEVQQTASWEATARHAAAERIAAEAAAKKSEEVKLA